MKLITGGLGFIGNELARQLAREHEVVILDNRNRVAPRLEDLSALPVREVDITDHAEVQRVIRELRPEVVFHLAAIHYIPECNANPERTLRVNVEGTQGMLRACSAAGVRHFLYASSGAVYADSTAPLNETSEILPVDIYGWSKWFGENLCRWHGMQEGLPITIGRLFNNFGPRETNLHIIPEILQQLRQGDNLRLGNTTTRRDYIHTRDCAVALVRLALQPPQGVRAVNIASGYHASVDELIALLGQILGRKLTVTTDPARYRKADKKVQVADISLLSELTGWRPQIGLREGLTDLVKFEKLLP